MSHVILSEQLLEMKRRCADAACDMASYAKLATGPEACIITTAGGQTDTQLDVLRVSPCMHRHSVSCSRTDMVSVVDS